MQNNKYSRNTRSQQSLHSPGTNTIITLKWDFHNVALQPDLISSILLHDRMICSEICTLKSGWYTEFLDQVKCRWERWKQSLLMSSRVWRLLKVSTLKVDLLTFFLLMFIRWNNIRVALVWVSYAQSLDCSSEI